VNAARHEVFVANPVWVEMERDPATGDWKLARHRRLAARSFRKELVQGQTAGDLGVRVNASNWRHDVKLMSGSKLENYEAEDGAIKHMEMARPHETLRFVVDLASDTAASGVTIQVNGKAAGSVGL
jgi:hypothetical protein